MAIKIQGQTTGTTERISELTAPQAITEQITSIKHRAVFFLQNLAWIILLPTELPFLYQESKCMENLILMKPLASGTDSLYNSGTISSLSQRFNNRHK